MREVILAQLRLLLRLVWSEVIWAFASLMTLSRWTVRFEYLSAKALPIQAWYDLSQEIHG